MGKTIGSSESSKVMFMAPRNLISTLEGIGSVLGDAKKETISSLDIDLERIKRR
jgi:hypothetical protein